MTVIISDSTSLILLAKIGLLEIFVGRNKIVIPGVVYREVIKGKEKGREDSMLVERLVAERKLTIKSPARLLSNKIKSLFNLKGGEREVIALASSLKDKCTILTDDKKCLSSAKALNINFIISLDVVVVLYVRNAIKKEVALECINKLEEYGWYHKDLIKTYREAIK